MLLVKYECKKFVSMLAKNLEESQDERILSFLKNYMEESFSPISYTKFT